jgi:cathepsin L
LTTESNYPYTSSNGDSGTCNKIAESQGMVAATTYADIAPNSVDVMLFHLGYSPVSVCLDSSETAFRYYTGGVVTTGCGTTVDHCVLITGWQTNEKGQNYYLVKNSWGTSWG